MRADVSPRVAASLTSTPTAGAQTGSIFRYAGHLWFDDGTVVTQLDRQIGEGTQTGYVMPVSEAIAAGALINIFSNAGVTTARNASAAAAYASAPRRANAFALAAQSTVGGNLRVYKLGNLTGLSGLTPGLDYWLSATAGAVATPSAASAYTGGQLIQPVGTAIDATTLAFVEGLAVITA